MNIQQSEIVTQKTREELQMEQVDPRSPDLQKKKQDQNQQPDLRSPETRKQNKIKSIIEVQPIQPLPVQESSTLFKNLQFNIEQKPKLQKSIFVLKEQIDKKMFENPIQKKIIEKAEDVIKALVQFDEQIGSLIQDSFHFKLKQQNLSDRLSEISSELIVLYQEAKSQGLKTMTQLNQMIQNMLQVEMYSKYCQDILSDFIASNFRHECSRYLAVEFL